MLKINPAIATCSRLCFKVAKGISLQKDYTALLKPLSEVIEQLADVIKL